MVKAGVITERNVVRFYDLGFYSIKVQLKSLANEFYRTPGRAINIQFVVATDP